ncbi:MAG: BrnA antitoxin family protein [Oscillospiraceae bacterium]|nr:BrnA antitoxin family protein [Oscillospiraceae bacterium]
MVRLSIKDLEKELTPEELSEIEEAAKLPPVFDADSPEMTEDMLLQFKKLRQSERNKQTLSLRLSPSTLKKAKAYGKGYTSFLSRLLDEAINDDTLVRKCI